MTRVWLLWEGADVRAVYAEEVTAEVDAEILRAAATRQGRNGDGIEVRPADVRTGSFYPETLRAREDTRRAWADLEARYGLVDANEVARPDGSLPVEEYLVVQRGDKSVLPGFQIEHGYRTWPGFPEILAVFRNAGWSAQSIALWFTSPNGYLDDTEPAITLRTDPDAVRDAAINAAAEW